MRHPPGVGRPVPLVWWRAVPCDTPLPPRVVQLEMDRPMDMDTEDLPRCMHTRGTGLSVEQAAQLEEDWTILAPQADPLVKRVVDFYCSVMDGTPDASEIDAVHDIMTAQDPGFRACVRDIVFVERTCRRNAAI